MAGDKSTSEKPKFVNTFQSSWLAKWPWLRKDEKGMTCALCLKHKKVNTMTSGSDNYRTSTIDRHLKSNDHTAAMIQDALSKDFVKVRFVRN